MRGVSSPMQCGLHPRTAFSSCDGSPRFPYATLGPAHAHPAHEHLSRSDPNPSGLTGAVFRWSLQSCCRLPSCHLLFRLLSRHSASAIPVSSPDELPLGPGHAPHVAWRYCCALLMPGYACHGIAGSLFRHSGRSKSTRCPRNHDCQWHAGCSSRSGRRSLHPLLFAPAAAASRSLFTDRLCRRNVEHGHPPGGRHVSHPAS